MSDDSKPGNSKTQNAEESGGAEGGFDAKTLKEFLALPENAEANYVIPLTWCPHLDVRRN